MEAQFKKNRQAGFVIPLKRNVSFMRAEADDADLSNYCSGCAEEMSGTMKT
jgi:hypothetical protein